MVKIAKPVPKKGKDEVGELVKTLLEETKDEFQKQRAMNGNYKDPNSSIPTKIAGFAGDALAEIVDTSMGLVGSGITGGIAGFVIPVVGPTVGFFGGMGVYATCRIYKAARGYTKSRKKKE